MKNKKFYIEKIDLDNLGDNNGRIYLYTKEELMNLENGVTDKEKYIEVILGETFEISLSAKLIPSK